MMKNLFILCLMAFSISAMATPQDSIGIKVVNGTQYIMHKVSKGEGVYGISKHYGVTASSVFSANPGSESGIKIDQVLLIPMKNQVGAHGNNNSQSPTTTTTKKEKIYHTVKSGQTLSSIARQYSTTVAEIKKLNKLSSDNIQLGQKLVVGEKTITVTSKPVTPVVEKAPEIKEPEVKEPEIIDPAPQSKPVEPVINKVPEPKSNNVVVAPQVEEKPMNDKAGEVSSTYSTDDGDEINETGMAVISNEGDLNQDRSFILHPTAKVGTIVMITNPANNATVFARVVGNCKSENGTLLKMSKTVANKLGISENSEVKLSYAK